MAATTDQLRNRSKQRTLEVLNQPGSTQRFAPSPLQQIKPALKQSASFLAPGMQNPFAASMNYQRMPAMDYANYEKKGPTIGGELKAPIPKPGMVPSGTQPVVLPNPDAPTTSTEPTDPATQAEELLADINEFRIIEGLEPFETFEDFQRDIGIFEGININVGMADGGIASLEPMDMNEGGIMSALSNAAGSIGQSFKNFGTGMKENFQQNMAGTGPLSTPAGGKRIEDMTREELLNYIKGGQKPDGGIGSISLTDVFKGRPQGATAALNQMGDLSMLGMADGDFVEYPRMNGQISGPGTERSDDIKAMLSDGEFVVNAKAVRGIGKMDGANGSKQEQRQKGARMMYAMQKAGEQAMRKG